MGRFSSTRGATAWHRAGIVCLAMIDLACDPAPPAAASASPIPAPVALGLPLQEEFLWAAAPLPSSGLHILYDVDGPQGRRGTMEIFARPGGYLFQQWTLSAAAGGEALSGTWVLTPEVQWSHSPGQPTLVLPQALGEVARAYAKLPPEVRGKILRTLHTWQEALMSARTRTSDHHAADERLGVPCHNATLVGLEYCVWEEAGVVLSYRSESFRVEVRQIERDVAVDPSLFEIPEGAQPPADPPSPIDPHATLEDLAAESYTALARLRRPAFHLSLADG